MGATQFAIFKLKHGADIDDPSTQAGKMYRETARSAAMQEGFQGQYFGRKIEDPDTLVWILSTCPVYLFSPPPGGLLRLTPNR